MGTRADEIADGIYRISTWVAEVAPAGRVQLQPVPHHRGRSPAVPHRAPGHVPARVRGGGPGGSVESVRWITFGHIESDECGSMNQWLAAAPHAEVAHGAIGCMISLNDLADRPPHVLQDGEVLDRGGKRIRHLDTPHVPHCREARVLFEETTGTPAVR